MARIIRNLASDEKDEAKQLDLKAHATREQGVVDRLTAGKQPPIAHWSEQQLERMIKTNSAFRGRADELREAHAIHGTTRPQSEATIKAKSAERLEKAIKTKSAQNYKKNGTTSNANESLLGA